jgi:hypothetical protein
VEEYFLYYLRGARKKVKKLNGKICFKNVTMEIICGIEDVI